jgi:hypothetical protein
MSNLLSICCLLHSCLRDAAVWSSEERLIHICPCPLKISYQRTCLVSVYCHLLNGNQLAQLIGLPTADFLYKLMCEQTITCWLECQMKHVSDCLAYQLHIHICLIDMLHRNCNWRSKFGTTTVMSFFVKNACLPGKWGGVHFLSFSSLGRPHRTELRHLPLICNNRCLNREGIWIGQTSLIFRASEYLLQKVCFPELKLFSSRGIYWLEFLHWILPESHYKFPIRELLPYWEVQSTNWLLLNYL